MKKRQKFSEVVKKTTETAAKIPEGLWLHKAKLISLSLLLALSHLKKPAPLPLTYKGESITQDQTHLGGRNEKYISSEFIKSSDTIPQFPYEVQNKIEVYQTMPQLPDSLQQKLHVEGQFPLPLDMYGQWLCQEFTNQLDITDLPSFVEGTIDGNQAEAVCAAAAMQFLVRVYGGLPHLTPQAQDFFKMKGKSAWILPETMKKVGYNYITSNDIKPQECLPGDIIYARFDHSHYIQQALNESGGKHPGTHTIVYLGEQTFSIPHPCPGDNDKVHILQTRWKKQNHGVGAKRSSQKIQKLIDTREITVDIINNQSIHITSPMVIQRLPDNTKQVTTPHISSWREFFLKQRNGSSINPNHIMFMQTGYSHLTQPEKLFKQPDILQDTRRNEIKKIETLGLLRLEKDKTLSHYKQSICEEYNLGEQDWESLLKYQKIITFRDAARENFPLPIPLLSEENKKRIDSIRHEKYPTESTPIDRSNIQKYTETFNAHNTKERSENPSSITSSGRMQLAILPGMTKTGICESLRQQIQTLSTDQAYQEYISFDRSNIPREKIRKARCNSAQLSSEEGVPINIVTQQPEKIQAGTTYARHLSLFLQELHNDIDEYHSIHRASLATIDQIDPTINMIINAVTPHNDIRSIMQKIHYAENLPSGSLEIGHRRKTKKIIRESLPTFHNTTGGRWQINHQNFTHPESIIKTVRHLKTLNLYKNFDAKQKSEIEFCETLAKKIVENYDNNIKLDQAKKDLADRLRDHIGMWSTTDNSHLHRYLFEAGLVANNIETNKKNFVEIVETLDNKAHKILSFEQRRVVDELTCLAHNRGPTVVRQIMTINWLARIIDQSRLGYRTQINKDLTLIAPEGDNKYTRNKKYYQSYVTQIKEYIDKCIIMDSQYDHPHFTQPLKNIVAALQEGTKESLLDEQVQKEIKKLTDNNSFINLKHINLSILPTIEELYGKPEYFFLDDPEVSHEGQESKLIQRKRQTVLSRITASYLDQVPKDKTLLTILLRSDALLGVLWLLALSHAGKNLYARRKKNN